MLCKEVYGEPEEEEKSAGGIESYSVIGKDAIDILEKSHGQELCCVPCSSLVGNRKTRFYKSE